ncbi:MAG: hypothetical protein ACLRWP_12085 [Bilophila wadsworthia]
MTIHTEDQLQEPQAEPKATPAKRPARSENRPRRRIAAQPKARPQAPKAQPEPVQESAPEPAAVAELVTAAPEAYDPAPALSAPCSEPCPDTCSAPAAETAELAEETPLTTAVMPESPVMADSLTHGQRVAAIAATLFQDLAELHGLDDVWGHRLHLAAQLHDIGFAEGRKGHHKISMRLIEEDLSLNIHEDDRPWVALLARYHRKAWPSRRHARFDALKKRPEGAAQAASCSASRTRSITPTRASSGTLPSPSSVRSSSPSSAPETSSAGSWNASSKRAICSCVFGRELECVCQGRLGERKNHRHHRSRQQLGPPAARPRPCGRITAI